MSIRRVAGQDSAAFEGLGKAGTLDQDRRWDCSRGVASGAHLCDDTRGTILMALGETR